MTNSFLGTSQDQGLRNDRANDVGFSVVELLIVISIIAILAGVTVYALYPTRERYGPDDEATKVVNLMREAHQRAMSQLQMMRLRIDLNAREIVLTDEGTLGAGDEEEVRRVPLGENVSLVQPNIAGAPMAIPPAPYDYPSAIFQSGVWEALFTAEGSVIDTTAAPAPVSATFFFWPTSINGQVSTGPTPTDVRAITVFGPSSSLRFWRHNGDQFNAETR
jgi:hypothetical protein